MHYKYNYFKLKTLKKIIIGSLILMIVIIPSFYQGIVVFITTSIFVIAGLIAYRVFENPHDNSGFIVAPIVILMLGSAWFYQVLADIALVLYIVITICFIVLQMSATELWRRWKHPFEEISLSYKVCFYLSPIVTIAGSYIAFDQGLYLELRNDDTLNFTNLIKDALYKLAQSKLPETNYNQGISSLGSLSVTSCNKLAAIYLGWNALRAAWLYSVRE